MENNDDWKAEFKFSYPPIIGGHRQYRNVKTGEVRRYHPDYIKYYSSYSPYSPYSPSKDPFFKWLKIIGGFILFLIILGIGSCAYHCHKYKCVKGHYYKEWNAIPPSHYETRWQCDSEILRTEYNKHHELYKNCNCK